MLCVVATSFWILHPNKHPSAGAEIYDDSYVTTSFLLAVLWKVELLHFISYQHFCKYKSHPYLMDELPSPSRSLPQNDRSHVTSTEPTQHPGGITGRTWLFHQQKLPTQPEHLGKFSILFRMTNSCQKKPKKMDCAGAARASYNKTEVAGRKKQAAQHICFKTSERNEVAPKERLFLLSQHTRDC